MKVLKVWKTNSEEPYVNKELSEITLNYVEVKTAIQAKGVTLYSPPPPHLVVGLISGRQAGGGLGQAQPKLGMNCN